MLAGVLDSRRRRAERDAGPDYMTPLRAWEALGMSPFIAFTLAGLSAAERVPMQSP